MFMVCKLSETGLLSIWNGFVYQNLITLEMYIKLNGFSSYASAGIL
jgi:hypothetical protein